MPAREPRGRRDGLVPEVHAPRRHEARDASAQLEERVPVELFPHQVDIEVTPVMTCML